MQDFVGRGYRIIEFKDEETGELSRAIHEVFYNREHQVVMYADSPLKLQWKPGEDQEKVFEYIKMAFDAPVLFAEDLKKP